MSIITSHQNHKIKLARSLRKRKYREEHGLFLAEGIFHVGEAIASDAPVEYILYTPDILKGTFANQCIQDAKGKNIPCFPVSENLFINLVAREHSQGTLAVVKTEKKHIRQYSPIEIKWGVALVSPQDPGNVGAVLRTINALDFDALILINDSVDHYHPTAVRASMGSIFRQPIINTKFNEFISWTQKHGYHVYGSSARVGVNVFDFTSYKLPLLLLLGGERQGLSNDQLEICEEVLKLPIKGEVTSLNLAVAAGILMYQIDEKLDTF